jgi:Reverse transcriptase (RNA-dependent DNA polymerase).
VAARRYRKDLAALPFNHPAKRLLKLYRSHGVPVKLSSKPWSEAKLHQALMRGPHKSCRDYHQFLSDEFVDMINKGQWTILPYSLVKQFTNLRLSPPGVVPQRDRRPRWIVDYSFYNVNQDTLPLVAEDAMQFGHALARVLRHILLADPRNGPVYLMKLDIADGFYRIDLNPEDIPKLGVVFPSPPGVEPLVALPLVLPMGWKNSPPAFCTATETIADLANSQLQKSCAVRPHVLGPRAGRLDDLRPEKNPTREPKAYETIQPDPCLPRPAPPVAEVDVYVDDFLGVAQGDKARLNQVRDTMLHSVDSVFRPNDAMDTVRAEPVSLKKLDKGDAAWKTRHTILGWDIDTTAKTIALPPHRVARLREILDSVAPDQRRIGVTKWHGILGELRSMSLALPGSRGLFSHLQAALQQRKGGRIPLNREVHQALTDFRWILENIALRPTRIAELVPLLPSALGYHDASGAGTGGVWFPADHLVSRGVTKSAPLLWRYQWPEEIRAELVTDQNPQGSISISDLELAGGLLHLDVLCQHYDIRERTILSKTDNLAALYWQRRVAPPPPRYLPTSLRLFGIHQRLHHYVPRHDYIPGGSNPLADDASRLFHLSNHDFLNYFNSTYPQETSFQCVTPTPSLLSAVISALLKKPYNVESLQAAVPVPKHTGRPGVSTQLNWASTPFSKPSKTRYLSYKSSSTEYDPALLHATAVPSSLERLKITYGVLGKRLPCWATKILA